jgi:hypothetical protein
MSKAQPRARVAFIRMALRYEFRCRSQKLFRTGLLLLRETQSKVGSTRNIRLGDRLAVSRTDSSDLPSALYTNPKPN